MRSPLALQVLGLCALVCGWHAPLRADAIPYEPEPTCEEGYVPIMTHAGAACVRPSCWPGRPCPAGLVCPPRHCVATVVDASCVEGRETRAKEPPDPCVSHEVRGPCDAEGICPEGSWCSASSCALPEELAELEARRGAAPASGAGGGCCGSRGARSSASLGGVLMMSAVLGFFVRARRARSSA